MHGRSPTATENAGSRFDFKRKPSIARNVWLRSANVSNTRNVNNINTSGSNNNNNASNTNAFLPDNA